MLQEDNLHSLNIQNFLDSFKAPVMLVDSDNKVLLTNKSADEVLPVAKKIGRQYTCGKMLNCSFAEKPEGCGKTVHCKSCVIRKAIIHTYETGKGYSGIASPDNFGNLEEIKPSMKITSEKFGNRILLRIDPIEKKERNDY